MTERISDSELLEKYSELFLYLNNPLVPTLGKIAVGCEHQRLMEQILQRNLLNEAIEIYSERIDRTLYSRDDANLERSSQSNQFLT